MSTIFRSTLPDVYIAHLAELFWKTHDEHPTLYTKVARVMPSTKGYEDWFEMAGLGQFRLKPEGTPISTDAPVQGSRRRVTHSTFALAARRTLEAMADKRYDVIDQIPKDLAASGREHQELLFWSLLDNGFTTTVHVTIDGLALYSTAHPILKPKDPTAATASNRANPGIALGTAGLEAGITAMKLTKSREDRFTPIEPKWLVYNPQQDHFAYQLLNAEKEVLTNENQPNTVSRSRTGIQPLAVPWLTDQEDWHLLADKSQHKLTYWNRMDLTYDTGTDMYTKDEVDDAMYRASVAPMDWRGVYGSSP